MHSAQQKEQNNEKFDQKLFDKMRKGTELLNADGAPTAQLANTDLSNALRGQEHPVF